METIRQPDNPGAELLMEKIRTLELKEKIYIFKKNACQKKVNELDAALRIKTGELATLSETLNAHLQGKRRAGKL